MSNQNLEIAKSIDGVAVCLLLRMNDEYRRYLFHLFNKLQKCVQP